tara:strand:- start:179 stop:442 length:264 start_codon:yes stop_codon:yes gene_type:complete
MKMQEGEKGEGIRESIQSLHESASIFSRSITNKMIKETFYLRSPPPVCRLSMVAVLLVFAGQSIFIIYGYISISLYLYIIVIFVSVE